MSKSRTARPHLTHRDVSEMRSALFEPLAETMYNTTDTLGRKHRPKRPVFTYVEDFGRRGTKWYVDFDVDGDQAKFSKKVMRAFARHVGAKKLKHGQYRAYWGNKKFYFHFSGGTLASIIITCYRQNFSRA